MNIKVLSEREIAEFRTEETHVVISIRTPGAGLTYLPKSKSRIATLFLSFPDLDQAVPNTAWGTEDKLFNKKQAETILLMIEGLKEYTGLVICQCEAGISRSAGVAGALSYIYNGDDYYFFKHYLPNRLVYKTILETYYGERNGS